MSRNVLLFIDLVGYGSKRTKTISWMRIQEAGEGSPHSPWGIWGKSREHQSKLNEIDVALGPQTPGYLFVSQQIMTKGEGPYASLVFVSWANGDG